MLSLSLLTCKVGIKQPPWQLLGTETGRRAAVCRLLCQEEAAFVDAVVISGMVGFLSTADLGSETRTL